MIKNKVLVLWLCLLMLIVSQAVASNQIKASAIPAGTLKAGELITVPLIADLSGLPEKLGSFTANLTWDVSVLRFVSAGGAEAFKNPVINDNRVAEGRIDIAAVNPQGASGKVQLATLQFEVIGGAGSSATIDLEFTAMAGANTFSNLMPYLDTEISSIQVGSALPTDYSLAQNHPNPFNPITRIQYSVPEETHVRIQIYNLLGESVRTLVNQRQEVGSFEILWNSQNDEGIEAPAGMYIYEIKAGSFSDQKKMMLVK